MSDQHTATAVSPETAKAPAPFALADIEKTYFGPSALGTPEFTKLVSGILNELGLKPKSNFSMSEGVPDGYGILVLPIAKRENGENVNYDAAIVAVPDFDLAVSTEAGQSFIKQSYIDKIATKVSNTVRPRKDGTIAASIPFKPEEFFEGARAGESLKTFTALAPDFVSALRKKGMRSITQATLRLALSSKPFASQQYPKVEAAGAFVTVLGLMIESARQKGLPDAILVNWRDTRDENDVTDDLGDISDLAAELGIG